ncbi:MAG: 23S rRNA (guanosine(2251)-2'-O)-methyltransferase RlmB [Candidatus Methylomirabilales bacterium]
MAPAGGSDDAREIIYGLHAVREALRAGTRSLLRISVLREDRQFAEVVRLARAARVPVYTEPKQALDRLVTGGKHQGVIGLVATKRYAEPEEMLAIARARGEPPFVVILDGVEDPHNLGAVIRTAEAAGVHGVILPDRRAIGLTGTVAKASAGALEHVHVARAPNLSRVIENLQSEGLWVYAVDPRASKPYTALDLAGPVAVVLGGEGRGIRPGVLDKCDDSASIPMQGRVESLNVSVAGAILMYEVLRQRMLQAKFQEK